ncbi:formylglycine-generating enzyme family protein [Phytohabitans sp. ZYX-F-186]|uniref:Formylglycine-generating enzyme family protein n=1 Tax=Phytohabitans maris TaxID=3071409 RepID=A0ABU0ZPQ5_9ACTN|nr:formylglycine-generating enzyme family protein [Phytohabitans sp. ZYX-F-186]MDQ7909011.1 formylglycine-generating enzyme family protein [Phytohabitans sp. ZYX-F-186]
MMRRIEGGTLLMGSEEFYPEEGPVVEVAVAAFEIDETAVSNAEFARFVAETGYVTVAERPLDPAEFDIPEPAGRAAGSLVFTPTRGPVDLGDWRQWWRWVPGAQWRHPRGPGSTIEGMGDHPVVQIAFDDAVAYAAWAGKRLPTEPEWEWAARGGLVGARFAWGDDPQEPDALRANTWQGRFPYLNTGANGWIGTAPVRSFPPNGYGLFEMTGNTWEWTDTTWSTHESADGSGHCGCGPDATSGDRVLKGGSHLCSPDYCLRYRPAARSRQSVDSAATHIGFRCARSVRGAM